MTEIAICVATRQRPDGLRRTLLSLAALNTNRDLTVLVADNDPDLEGGIALAKQMRTDGYRWPMRLMVVDRLGIPQARNALVTAALALPDIRWIAMLDDDEAAEPGWLEAMLACQAATGADVVGGAVLRQFEGEIDPWMMRHPILAPKSRARSGRVPIIDSTANVLMSAEALRAMGEDPFDERMALTGGSDKQLFVRMRRRGVRFAWAEEARVTELVPASRINAKWLLMRGYRVGMTDMLAAMDDGGRFRAAMRETPRIIAGLALGSVGPILTADPGIRVTRLGRLYRAGGKVAALMGRHYEEYRKVHGA